MSDSIRLLVIGDNEFPFHRFETAGPLLREALAPVGDVELTTDKQALAELPASDVSVVVDYLTDSRLTDEQRDGLLAFIEQGGGYLPVHCGGDLNTIPEEGPTLEDGAEPFVSLREVIGGHFLTHPEQSAFDVEIAADHPVTDGVSTFQVYDEPYQVEWDDDVEVLAWMDHEDLDRYPVVWVTSFGAGRVCYCSLGHTEEALENDSVVRLLQNAAGWTAGN